MFYTTKQAMEYLNISRQALTKYIQEPRMPISCTRLDSGAWIFSQAELDNFKRFMQTDTFQEMTKPGRKPDDPITKTIVTEDGEKKRINLRSRSRGRTSRTRSRRETD